MAISLKTAGTWARMVTDGGTVAIPGSPAAGNRMFLFGSWKTYTITVADPANWNLISDFSDGAVAAGNGTGSVHNAVWYRDWQSGDAAPVIDYSAAPTEGHWVIMLWQKGAGDTWGSPVARTGAIAAADPFTVDASATVTVPDASVVMCLIGLRDDSTAMTRATDAIDDTGGLVTWNGNYVESPATHFNSTTGLDMAGDLGHRLVTTGAAGVTLHADGDPTAAETGSATFIIQGLFTSDPQTATPSTASLTTATFAPTVTASDHKTATPTTAALATTAFAPTVSTPRLVTPGVAALSLTTFAPTVTAGGGVEVIPGTATLSLATFAPSIAVSDHKLVTPGTRALALTRFAPTVATTANVTARPSTASLVLTGYAPTVSGGGEPEVFAPWLHSRRISQLPTPTRATWRGLMRGSMHRRRRRRLDEEEE